jgi:histidinol dehydrogenase
LGNGGLILARDLDQAVTIVNDYASEHVQLAVANPSTLAAKIRYAGTLLLGQWTSFAASNFAIGTPATLPTTGYARRASAVTAHTFLNTIATAQLTQEGFWDIAETIEALADHEGFPAHHASVTQRRDLHQRPAAGPG